MQNPKEIVAKIIGYCSTIAKSSDEVIACSIPGLLTAPWPLLLNSGAWYLRPAVTGSKTPADGSNTIGQKTKPADGATPATGNLSGGQKPRQLT